MNTEENRKNQWGGWIMAGGCLVLLALGILFLLWNRLPPEVPWLYSLPWGEQQLISKTWFGAGLGGLVMMLGVCGWFSLVLSKEDPRASVLLSRGGFVLIVIYLLSFFQVLRLMI